MCICSVFAVYSNSSLFSSVRPIAMMQVLSATTPVAAGVWEMMMKRKRIPRELPQ